MTPENSRSGLGRRLLKVGLCGLGILLVLTVLFMLFQYGPTLLPPKGDTLLDFITLADGSKLYGVETWDNSYLEPYEVSLYRKDSQGRIYVCFLGDEFNHWWSFKFRRIVGSDTIELWAFGFRQGNYTASKGFAWRDPAGKTEIDYLIDGIQVKTRIPPLVLEK